MTTILQAIKNNQFIEAEQLIANGQQVNAQDDCGMSALHHATLKGNSKLVKILLEAGCNPNIRTLQDAVCNDEELDNSEVESIIQNLLGLGNKTPLHIAAKDSNYEIGQMLIEYGADTNSLDAGLCTPLHWSANRGDLRFSRLLLDNSSNPNARDMAWSTPLHEATRKNHMQVVKLLMNYKADPYIKDICAQSAIEIAQNNVRMLNIYQCYVVSNSAGTMH